MVVEFEATQSDARESTIKINYEDINLNELASAKNHHQIDDALDISVEE